MRLPLDKRRVSRMTRGAAANAALRVRTRSGNIIPFVAIALPAMVAFVGMSIDMTRAQTAVRKLHFAAENAAMYAYAYATNSDGTYTDAAMRTNVAAALQEVNGASGSAWHRAPAGPTTTGQSPWESDVIFSDNNVSFETNPADQSEVFPRITARRDGNDAIKTLFLPLIYSFNSLFGEPTAGEIFISPTRTVEVVGQPATRIGAGAPRTSSAGTRTLAGFATFPLALSNVSFSPAAQPGAPLREYRVELTSSTNNTGSPAANRIVGSFINDARALGGTNYYGDAQGNNAIDQLIGLYKYFYTAVDSSAVLPAAVERGVSIRAFDPADQTFILRKQNIVNALGQVGEGKTLVLPVIRTNPVFNAGNEVLGFARVRVTRWVNPPNTDFDIRIQLVDSVPVRNASARNGVATIPTTNGALMPAPQGPFLMRTYDAANDSVSVRPRGVALAPAFSPRRI